MYYYLCEIEVRGNNVIKIALKDEIIGVSSEFIDRNIEGNFLGYTKFKNQLYPVLSLSEKKNFILKIFLIYKSFAFGITSIIKKEKINKIEKFNEEILEKFPHLKIFSGYFEYENEEFFVFNIDKAFDEFSNEVIIKTINKKKEEKELIDKPNVYIVDEKISILKNTIISIIDKSNFCPFKHDKYEGFLEYKNKIYPVKKTSENSKWIVLSSRIALLCEKIESEYGEIYDAEDKKVVKINGKTLPILE